MAGAEMKMHALVLCKLEQDRVIGVYVRSERASLEPREEPYMSRRGAFFQAE